MPSEVASGCNPASQQHYGVRLLFDEESPRKVTYTEAEYRRIRDAAEPNDRPVFVILANTGMRCSELGMLPDHPAEHATGTATRHAPTARTMRSTRVAVRSMPQLSPHAPDRCTPNELRDRIVFTVGAAPGLAFRDGEFQAVWACASLLHLPRHEMALALKECRRVLCDRGLLFLGMKRGEGQADDNGRLCTFWRVEELYRLAEKAAFFVLWTSERPSLDGRDLSWIELLAEAS